jgi:uncharacterized protein YacL (UPF0231 family)
MQKFGSNTSEKEAKNSKMIPKMLDMRKDAKQNEEKQSEMKRKFCLFVSQTEAKIMRNGLRFASISHEAKKKFKRKRDTLLNTVDT